MDSKRRFGDRIKSIRLQLKLSQEEMAFRCGITAAQVGYIERGERTATLETVEKLAAGLNMTSSELLDYGKEPNVKSYDEITNKIISIALGLSTIERKRALMIMKALECTPEE